MTSADLKIRFMSQNNQKAEELRRILQPAGIQICFVAKPIKEIQSSNLEEVVRDKVLQAFNLIGRAVLVEHTALCIDSLSGFPGPQTQYFWDSTGAQQFSKMFKDLSVTAKSAIGYCDGRKIHIFVGELRGKVAETPSHCNDFEWDSIFIPSESADSKPLADMGEEKHKISMRRKALEKFCLHLGRELPNAITN